MKPLNKSDQCESDERQGLPSASIMGRLASCPGSWILCQVAEQQGQVSTPPYEEMAARGDRIHAAIASGKLDTLPDEEADIATKLMKMRDKAVADWRSTIGSRDERLLVERRLWLKARTSRQPLCSAKVDMAIVAGDEAFMLDYKTGFMSAPQSVRNYQIRTAIVALRCEFPNLKRARGAIASNTWQQGFDAVDYDLQAIDMSEREILLLLWRSQRADAPRTAGPWCHFCPGRGICVEAASYSLLPVAASGIMTDLPSKEEIRSVVALMGPEQLAFVQRRGAIIRNILDAVTLRMKAFSADDLAKVGFKKETQQGNRYISDIVGLYHALHAENLMDNVELFKICEVPIGALQDLLVPKLLTRGAPTKKAATKEVDAKIEPHLARLATKEILVDIAP